MTGAGAERPPVRVAAAQMCSGLDPAANLATIERLVGAAAREGAAYVLTPEVAVAYPRNSTEMAAIAEPFAGNSAIASLSALSRRHELFLHLGSLAVELDDGKFANRSVLFGPDGAVLAAYDKIHLFDADPPGDRAYRESAAYRAGETALVTAAAGFRLGLSICFDLRFPALYGALAGAGAEVLAVPAAFTRPTGSAHWEVLLRARAIETGSFVIAAAQGGAHENGRQTWGRSMIVSPWGEVLAGSDDDREGVILADLDLSRVADARARLPVLANARAFSLSVNQDLPCSGPKEPVRP